MTTVAEIIDLIKDMTNDSTLPKNVKQKLIEILNLLESDDEELSLRVNKALHELDEISADSNLQSYTRTQLLAISSALESIE